MLQPHDKAPYVLDDTKATVQQIRYAELEMTQTIEQLTARVRELEEENARLKVATNFGKSKDIHRLTEVVLSDCGISTEYRPLLEKVENRLYEFFDEQLATSQAYAEQLREVIEEFVEVCTPQFCACEPDVGYKCLACNPIEAVKAARELLALPHSTSALDAYVAEKVKDAKESLHYQSKAITTLTRQRDLAVEAITRAIDMVGHPDNITYLQQTLDAIKESEGK